MWFRCVVAQFEVTLEIVYLFRFSREDCVTNYVSLSKKLLPYLGENICYICCLQGVMPYVTWFSQLWNDRQDKLRPSDLVVSLLLDLWMFFDFSYDPNFPGSYNERTFSGMYHFDFLELLLAACAGLRLRLRSFRLVFFPLFGDFDLDLFFFEDFFRGELSRLLLLDSADGEGERCREWGDEAGES